MAEWSFAIEKLGNFLVQEVNVGIEVKHTASGSKKNGATC